LRITPGFIAQCVLLLIIGFMVLYPLAMLLYGSFWTSRPGFPGEFTLKNYIDAYTDPGTYKVFGTTVLLIGTKTLVAVALASTLAWIVTRTDTPFRGTLEVFMTVPFFIPGILETIGWILLLSPNTGTINVVIRSLFGLDGAPFNVYSLGGMIWVMSLGSTSFIFLLLVNVLRNMDSSLEESARASGAGIARVALTITLPLMLPIILSAGMLSFIRAMDAFETPVLLGLPAKPPVFVFSNRIYQAVQYDFPVNYGLATSLGVTFFALMICLILFQNRVLKGKEFSIITGKGYKPQVIRLGKFKWVTFALCCTFITFTTVLPVSQVVIGSFLKVFGLIQPDMFTLDNYTAILSDAALWRGLINTIVLAGGASLLTVVLCSVVSYVTIRTNFVGRGALGLITWLPWAIPGIVAGLGMLWAYIALPLPFGWRLYGTTGLLLLVFITSGIPLGTRQMTGVMMQLSRELEESSRVHGANWLYTFRRIVIPLIGPSMAGAFLLLFVGFSRAVSTTILFTGPGVELLAVSLFSYSQAGRLSLVSALATVLMVINVSALLIARRLGAFGEGAR
jgi:iron(III) transport system permease protein